MRTRKYELVAGHGHVRTVSLYLDDHFECRPQAVNIPGEGIKRLHSEWWLDMSWRHRNCALSTRPQCKLPTTLKINQIYFARGDSSITLCVVFGSGHHVASEDVLEVRTSVYKTADI